MDYSEKSKKRTQWVIDCYKCGTQNSFGLRYCVVCGERFIYKCPQCDADIDPDYQACPYCTVAIDWGYIPDQASSPVEIEAKKLEEREPKEKVKEQKVKVNRFRLPEKKLIWLIAFIIVVICIGIIFAVDIFL